MNWFAILCEHNKQQTTNNKQQTTNNKQQTTNNKQQTTNNKQQTTNNKQQSVHISRFSSIEIAHVAKLINLPQAQVEKKLSEMILDKKLAGILDQGAGVLEIFEVEAEDATYAAAIETISHTGQVVEALYRKAERLA
jgi:flagellar biosynthesis component FlhA